jgi:hypothetical protein
VLPFSQAGISIKSILKDCGNGKICQEHCNESVIYEGEILQKIIKIVP